LVVDGRLYLLNEQRLANLLQTDLPYLTLAIVAFLRGRCRAGRGADPVAYFEIVSNDGRIRVRVRADDWVKILPYLQSGAWDPDFAPIPEVGYLHPEVAYDISALPETDHVLYNRILTDLKLEFPRNYPTSPL
jgi:hypothetical protein